MTIEKVTPARLASVDHYRAQINVDQFLVAVGYGALFAFRSRDSLYMIRNTPAAVLAYENEIRRQVQLAIQRPAFSAFVGRFIEEGVDPSLQGRAVSLFQSLGWHGNTLL